MTVLEQDKVYLGSSPQAKGPMPEYIQLPFANRHGLITGATGTGKTVSLQIMAEGFSDAGVPVFCADIKGDVAGLAMPGEAKDFLAKRAEAIGFTADYKFEAFPVVFWDLFGKEGHPIRATISEMGPLLLARFLDLNDTQEGVLNIAFKVADEDGLCFSTSKDLQALLTYVAERASDLDHALRQRLQGDRRDGPAPAPRPRAAGRRQLLRRAGARHHRPACARPATAAASSTCSPPHR